MNEQGAIAKSGCAMSMARCIYNNKSIVIDDTFVLWIKREGIDASIFSGIFCEDVWKKPKGL